VIGVLASGRGTNLQALLDQDLPVNAVASNVEGTQALERAAAHDIPSAVFRLADYDSRRNRDEAMADWLTANGVELVVCAGYMHLLTKPFLDRFPCLNVHPSLLPDFPGSHAVEEALATAAAETGVTIHFLDEGMDTGPVIAQEAVPIRPDDTPESLHARLQSVEHRLLPETVRNYLAGALRSAS
jgi:phosphoribosylglycinamide formyltransferase-1